MTLKDKLINAGFRINGDENANIDTALLLLNVRSRYVIIVDTSGSYWIDDRACAGTPKFHNKFTDEHDLSKKLFGFTLEDLDFTPKKTYSWEECFDKGSRIASNSLITQSNDSTSKLNKNVFRTRLQANSSLAESQLTHIIDKLNKDFPSIEEGKINIYYPVLGQELYDSLSGITYLISSTLKINKLGCVSKKAYDKLVETNLPLLLQYFEHSK